MAQLALRAFAYGVDKIPDSAWDRVPGFQDKEKKRLKEQEKRRSSRQYTSSSRRTRSDSRGPKRSGERNRRYHDDGYNSDTGENAHSYGKHREGYSVSRDSRALDRNRGGHTPPPTDPTPGVPQHEAGHYPEPPSHPHGQQHYLNQSQNKNINPGIDPNQHFFPPPPTQASNDLNLNSQPPPQVKSPDQMAQSGEYYPRPGPPPSGSSTGYSSGAGNTQYATQYPSATGTPNPYAPQSGTPAGMAASGAFSPPPSSSSSSGQRYRPQHSLNGATTAGPYDRVYQTDSPAQPASAGAAPREPYIPYSNAVYYNQPAQQAAAYRRGSLSSGSGGYSSRNSPRGSIGSRPQSRDIPLRNSSASPRGSPPRPPPPPPPGPADAIPSAVPTVPRVPPPPPPSQMGGPNRAATMPNVGPGPSHGWRG